MQLAERGRLRPGFLRRLYRGGHLTGKEFSDRLGALEELAAGKLRPQLPAPFFERCTGGLKARRQRGGLGNKKDEEDRFGDVKLPTRAPLLFCTQIRNGDFLYFPQALSRDVNATDLALGHSLCTCIPFGGTQMLFAVVRRGRKSGIRLFPHRCRGDDRYHVSLMRQGPHIPLADPRDIPDYLANGYSLGMSNRDEHYRPTLISPKSIQGWR